MKNIFIIPILSIALLVFNFIFVLDHRDNAIVIQFGDVIRQESTPGLKFKIPILQNVKFFDKRLQMIRTSIHENNAVVGADQKNMQLDAFAMYKIIDPQTFYKTIRDDNNFRIRIKNITESSIREVIGTVQFKDVLDIKRDWIRKEINYLVNEDAKTYGVDIVDVRIIRISLPDKTRISVYERMRSDREKEAKNIRAMGEEDSKYIKAKANYEKAKIIANAKKEAEIIKGKGDSVAIHIYSEAYKKDYTFFEFFKSLEIYKTSMKENTNIITSTNDNFLKFFNKN